MFLAAAGRISNSDSVQFAEVERFSNWCRDSSLDLNVKKTKEMLIDFRKAPAVIPDFFIDGVKVERVTEYKYLGIVLDKKLNLNKNTDFIHKRCQPRIFCLQKLRSLKISQKLRSLKCQCCCFTHFLPELY